MEGKKEIPDDVKLFLRSVLVASPGMQQSKVTKEYYQTTNERLSYISLGFKDLYEFLIALEGEVTRLEFSPKLGDNLVYAVLDKTKYASEHAKKYAKKVKTGLKAKSPEEITLWKKENKGNLPIVVEKKLGKHQSRKNHGNRNNGNHNHIQKPKITQPKREVYRQKLERSKEITPTFSEWAILRKLVPESNGVFTLAIRSIGVNSRIRLEKHPLVVHFSPYNMIVNSVKYSTLNSIQTMSISFPSFFTAYRAWREKDKSIIMGNRIGIEPSGGNLNALSCPLHMIIVLNLPVGLLMSTLVTIFAKYNGLICIDPRPRENFAIITYSNIESCNRACKEVTSIHVSGVPNPITVNILEGRSSMPFGVVDNLLRPVENKHCSSNAVLEQKPKHETLNTPNLSVALPVELEEKEAEIDVFNSRACGFCINYAQYNQMFQITHRKKPKSITDIPDEVSFLVTHQIQPIRFWGWLLSDDNNETVKALEALEAEMSKKASKVQPPHVLPKEGNRGAALYKDKEDNETWYRCYVLKAYTEKDEIEVFYCDYGNSEVIPRENFRSTYSEPWKDLGPQATPFKLNGYEMKDSVNNTDHFNLQNNGYVILKGTVVKSSLYSQPHIIELKNIYEVSQPSVNIDEKMTGSWCVPVGNEYKVKTKSEEVMDELEEVDDLESVEDSMIDFSETDDLARSGEDFCHLPQSKGPMESLFDYNESELALGILATAHSPNLIYLRLGDIRQFADLQNVLDRVELILPTCIEKGNIYLHNSKETGNRRRVLALQVLQAFGKVKVLHVDHGVIEWVLIADLHNLNQDVILKYPFQARPAVLGGIECGAETLEDAISYLKGVGKKAIKVHVMHDYSSGRICVELFDLHNGKSINKELVDKGLAIHVEGRIPDTDDEVDPSNVPTAVKELDIHKTSSLLPMPQANEESTVSLLQPNFDSNTKTVLQQPLAAEIELFINALQLSQKIQNVQDAASQASWNSNSNQNPFPVEGGNNINLPNGPVASLVNVSTWLDNSPVKKFVPQDESDVEHQQQVKNETEICINEVAANNTVVSESGNNDNKEKEQKRRSPVVPLMNVKTSSYAQPDIISSNIATEGKIDIDGRQIKIGNDVQKEVLNVIEDNKLSWKEVTGIRQKWMIEKESLLETKEKLEKLQKLNDEDLAAHYKALKLEKLQLKIKVKQAQKHIAKLDGEYEEVIQQTNHILSLI